MAGEHRFGAITSLVIHSALFVSLVTAAPQPAHASLLGGLKYIVAGVLELPRSVIAGTFGGPPVIGTVFGAVNGVLRSASLLTHGALQTAGGAAGTALKFLPFLPAVL